ncbi:hypothetical protein [Nocardiopsis sp. MG754419]|uniref:hypothetical protein n=1 Tax=Nocardiopsis sp. MG754419 TaxID=2259865 RepID=UPI001BACFED4|nr:hypothetical protein [Nocardiopsis sp. MG754419]MBR8745218.1 hypothetical protein [Nocardiopsis sp. MG754419]
MKAQRLRPGHVLLDHGHRFRVTAARTSGWPWDRRTKLYGFYEPTRVPATYTYPPCHEVETA